MGRNAHGVGPVVDQGAHPVVNFVGIVVVKVVRLHGEAGAGLLRRRLQQLLNVVPGAGGDGNDRHAQLGGKPGAVDHISVALHLVHKVQGDHKGALQLQQLGGEVKIALQVGGVHDVNNGVGMLPHDKISGHDLLNGIGGQGVDSRQIHHGDLLVSRPGLALGLFHRHSGPVAHILVGPREGVEEGGLPAVWVARQSKAQGLIRRGGGPGVSLTLVQVGRLHPAKGLLVGDVLHHSGLPVAVGLLHRVGPGGAHLNLPGILPPQRQLIPPQAHLDGVPHRGDFADKDGGAGGEPHVHQASLDRTLVVSDPKDDAVLPGGELLQCARRSGGLLCHMILSPQRG
ncbi:hypothetical protein SDC9_125780 [bioreactor metagenome]|uniref:Uncharacterized protein n=1 Tax=bioreactor metagenome TaxID=1076179 RepID=A0A645CPE2_9ZZZZ